MGTSRKGPGSSLADLYDPLTMPPELVQAHRKLDAAVDAAYARRKFLGDRDRLALLFELYQQLVSPLVAQKNRRRRPVR
ncbi:MAG TPA: type IIL restriction-modification enzyme MmeI [Desulfobaccales bacterium]